MPWKEILTIVGIPALRSVAGWLENSLKDGVISSFEWAKLGETVVRIGVIGLGIYFGLGQVLGVDINLIGASTGAVVLDFILAAIKKKKK